MVRKNLIPIIDTFLEEVSKRFKIALPFVQKNFFYLPKTKDLSKKNSKLFEQALNFISEEPDMKMTADKLKAMCKAKGLKTSGKKLDLVARIQAPKDSDKAKATRKRKPLFRALSVRPVIDTLKSAQSSLAIRKNDKGFYVDEKSKLVFNPVTKRVMGWWDDRSDDYQVRFLNDDKIQICKELRVPYDIPENLDLGIIKVNDKVLDEELGDDDFQSDVDTDDEVEEDEDDVAEN